MRSALLDDVSDVMRAVASEVIVPRFRSLNEEDVEEKAPGELVTVADREAEQLLSEALLELLPGSRVVGEEQTAKQPALLGQLESGTIWLIDPLDGTHNFVDGRPCFAVMIALLEAGETVAAWLLDPITDVMSRAERGAGAFVDGAQLHTAKSSPGAGELRGALLKKYMPDALRQQLEQRIPRLGATFDGMRCSGAEYPAVAQGQQHFAVFWRTLPWDHAPGALFLSEAGGVSARFDGTPYRVTDSRAGLLVAHNPTVWDETRAALFE
ncbi:MAG: inositol monophosphatase [Myxococcaceae bacterium]|nr:inositol monophosphatase [Myxococcaceae bacterium]